MPLDRHRRRDVHGGRDAVVRRLAHVDVIVRMHRRFRAELAAERDIGGVGDHLVDVHVGLRAGAGLPDQQREMCRRVCRRRSPARRRRLPRRGLRSSEPRSRLTSAAARLIRPSACTISIGMRSLPMRKLCSERSVCAPQSLSAGISSGPKASLSVRVVARFLGHGRLLSPRDLRAAGQGGELRRDSGPLLLAEAVETDDFAAAAAGFGSGPVWLRLRQRATGPPCRRGRGGRRAAPCAALLVGGLVLRSLAGAVCGPRLRPTSSNCRPNCTDGSKKPLIASNGTASFSGMPPNDRPTSKPVSLTLEIPELVLQDDGHLLGILRAQPVRHAHAVGVGVEGDVEMMVAGQALLGRFGEHAAHHAAQRLLGQEIVADLVGHGPSGNRQERP